MLLSFVKRAELPVILFSLILRKAILHDSMILGMRINHCRFRAKVTKLLKFSQIYLGINLASFIF